MPAIFGTWEWDLTTNHVIWSDGMAAIHGISPGAFSGQLEANFERVYPDDQERIRGALTDAIATGADHELEYRIVWPDGSVRWVQTRGRVNVGPDGRAVRLRGTCVDISDRKRAEEAFRFVAEAGEILAGSLDYETTLASVAHSSFPASPTGARSTYSTRMAGIDTVAVAHVDPEKVRYARELQKRYPPDPTAPGGVPQVLRTGRAELLPDIPDSLLVQTARDEGSCGLLANWAWNR